MGEAHILTRESGKLSLRDLSCRHGLNDRHSRRHNVRLDLRSAAPRIEWHGSTLIGKAYFTMASSMTGFARSQALAAPFLLVWEVRSVNHRFLDATVRLPAALRSLETGCRAKVKAALARGKVDCTLTVSRDRDHPGSVELSNNAIENLLSLQKRVREMAPDASSLSVGDVLRWPGVVQEATYESSTMKSAVAAALDDALKSLVKARKREGKRLAAAVLERCNGMKTIIAEMQPRIGQAEQRYRSKLEQRLDRLAVDADPQRLEQELAQLAQRLDISEEIDRLNSHIEEVETVLARDEPMGRRLDFLVQELNREANTLASKSQDSDLTRGAVELKVLVEQVREQVQNLE